MVTDFEKKAVRYFVGLEKYFHIGITWLPRRSPVDGIPKYLDVILSALYLKTKNNNDKNNFQHTTHEQICTVHPESVRREYGELVKVKELTSKSVIVNLYLV